MIERIITFSIRHRLVVIAGAVLLALAGMLAVWNTPVDAIPDLSENQVLVFTDWPGHGPREIEDQVTYPLSLRLQGMPGVRVVRSSSEFGFSLLSIIFEDGVAYAAAREEVGRRLAQAGAGLPAGVIPHLGPDAAATGQIFWYTVEGPGYDLGRLRAVQDWYVGPQIAAVPGVAEVASVGGYPIEYAVEVEPRKVANRGVTVKDVAEAVKRSNAAVGGHVVHKGNAEFIVRGAGWIGLPPGNAADDFDPRQAVRDLENVVVLGTRGSVRLGDVARIAPGPQPRRGALEKDGSEVTGGVVLMRQGQNPLEVTARIKDKVHELQAGLPPGVRIVPFYDRTLLIQGAVATVTATLVEATLTATVCVVLVLLHFRASFVVALTLPLSALGAFALLWLVRRLGIADVETNAMSLAGIAVSIGVLVDSSIVMAENVMHRLHEEYGDRPVRGDVRDRVLAACLTVGRPIFFSVVIMLLSFVPVFAWGGIEGKMFRPLALTKSFALLTVAVLAITLVPALCTVFIRGRLRGEMDSWIVRGVVRAYRPALRWSLDHPALLAWVVGVTFLLGLAPLGLRFSFALGSLSLSVPWLFLIALFLALAALGWTARRWWSCLAGCASLLAIAWVADRRIEPLGSEFLTPLDEGMVMDMPITIPRASIAQSVDDLKARDMIFCRFPEVDMVVGKAGRAETPTDPAPLDMIESMVNFRPRDLWPRRTLRIADAERQGRDLLDALCARGLVAEPDDRTETVNEAVMAALPRFDAQMREYAYQRNQEFERSLGPALLQSGRMRVAEMLVANGTLSRSLAPVELARLGEPNPPHLVAALARDLTPEDAGLLARDTVAGLERLGQVAPGGDPLRYRPLLPFASLWGAPRTFDGALHAALVAEHRARWRDHLAEVNRELLDRAPPTYTRLVLEELLGRTRILEPDVRRVLADLQRLSTLPAATAGGGHHHGGAPAAPAPEIDPCPALDFVRDECARRFAERLLLWPRERAELAGFGGELDRVMQMPGWTNVWTMPIQNRVDMLSTGVNTTVGVRVLGRRLDDVVKASEEVAAVLKGVRGAADVVADPLRGKGYLDVQPDRERAARLGVQVGDINDLVEIALGGKVLTYTVEGRERHPVRVRYPRDWRRDEESIAALPLPVRGGDGKLRHVALSQVADIRIREGPAAIKSENGLLRNYVRLNVRGRDAGDFVDEARRVVAARVRLPAGVFLEWTGQFEHQQRAWRTLAFILPLVVGLIFLVLCWTYRDLWDALLMLLPVLGAFAGGVFCQWLFAAKFSVTVWVGYIACFGMATATGIIMLIYLREAVARAGGLEKLSLDGLRQAVLEGAVHRLRPKLLTECTMVLGLAPLLWADGVGAEVLRPMVVPVLGGILVADEVIDLLLPVLFFAVRRRRWLRLHPGHGPGGASSTDGGKGFVAITPAGGLA
jgi:Cu(I)/Ag(I) efflux system membrane protein CusA/SilA